METSTDATRLCCTAPEPIPPQETLACSVPKLRLCPAALPPDLFDHPLQFLNTPVQSWLACLTSVAYRNNLKFSIPATAGNLSIKCPQLPKYEFISFLRIARARCRLTVTSKNVLGVSLRWHCLSGARMNGSLAALGEDSGRKSPPHLSVSTHICVYFCVHIYIYTYMCISICLHQMHIYTYIERGRARLNMGVCM